MKLFLRTLFLAILCTSMLSGCKKDDSSPVEDPKAENKKPLGTSAEDILSDDIYQSLVVELVYTQSFQPDPSSILAFKDFITARIHKPGGIVFIERTVPNQSGAPFTLTEIKAIEESLRTKYTSEDQMALYVFFANGSSNNDTQTQVTLGTAYQNTSMVIYQKTLETVTLDQPEVLPILEQTTLEHEFGHILGLVNIQNDDIHTNHEDSNNAKHCMVEGCLMYYDATNVLRSQLKKNLSRMGAVPQLDPLCLADLQAKGGQ
ncbi:MAG TPA: membrane metalloprotease [Flavobacteriaceae bacterium]|nr:membrane metalloprotease [Flavobacteriaceae bacterium]MCB9213975.1 membrane metalloprotease [Alteromonas sp.]HPF11866.1 membrane metalloprotease [Flavobacteriaceae bacterium]HQU21143.1 membrane metalloprotease [Flavobacteriaceae bacterium]HQU65343.1 membrane metalloprotease [Flavobacteriaceae bacterium]